MKRFVLLLFVCAASLAGCKHKGAAPKAPDVKTAEKIEIHIERTDKAMASLDVNKLSGAGVMLRNKYGLFFDLYGDGVLGIGKSTDKDFKDGLYAFLTYPVVREAFARVDATFSPEVMKTIESDLSDAFTLYKGTFPDRVVPKVYSYVAGFNQSIMIADSILAIGLDKYLGSNYDNYQSLGFPRYLSYRMDKRMIVPDAMYAWASGEFPMKNGSEPLLSHMIYQGKLMYLTAQMLPNAADTLLFGFTQKQMDWVKKNEKMMWEILISQKLLFNTDRMVYTKLIGEAPFTTLYTNEAPGRAAIWQGFRIVYNYMKNTKSSLNDLMKETDYQKILDGAKYRP